MTEYVVTNPATGEVLKKYPTATDEQIQTAVAAAAAAGRDWARTSTVADRSALVRRVAQLHNERKDELARMLGGHATSKAKAHAAELLAEAMRPRKSSAARA